MVWPPGVAGLAVVSLLVRRVSSMPPESRLVHPAVGAALAARNAVAAEMAVAGRSRMDPSDPCWAMAAQALEGRQTVQPERPLPVSVQSVVKPAKSRGRELAEMACWFAVGGVGGLVVLAVVRMVPPVLGW